MKNSTIFIRARNHVIKMDMVTGVYMAEPSRFVYRDVPQYKPASESSIFNNIIRRWFGLCDNTEDVLRFFWMTAGRMLIPPEKCECNIILSGGESNGAEVVKQTILSAIGVQQKYRTRHTITVYNQRNKQQFSSNSVVFPLWSDSPVITDNVLQKILSNDREMSAILNMMINGLQHYIRGNYPEIPDDCIKARNDIEGDMYQLDTFLSEKTTIVESETAWTRVKQLFDSYQLYNRDRAQSYGAREFTNQLMMRGYYIKKHREHISVRGVVLNE